MRRLISHTAAIGIGICMANNEPALFLFCALVMFSYALG